MDEQELIRQAKVGNKSALNTLFQNNLGILKGYVMKMVGEPELAQDIVQDTLLKAVVNIRKFEPHAKFSTWLIKIATNVYRDYLRKHRHTEILEETLPDAGRQVEEQVITDLTYQEVMTIVSGLPYEKRAVFILKHYHGYAYEEIAEILNCPIGTVRSRLHNAIKQIMKEIDRKGIL